MKERVFKLLAKLFHVAFLFFSRRATALETARVTSKYVGRRVRVTCGQTHYGIVLSGMWEVFEYDDFARDLKIKKVGSDGQGVESRNWVKPECVEVVS